MGHHFGFHNVTTDRRVRAPQRLRRAAYICARRIHPDVKHRDSRFVNLVRSTLERVENSEPAKENESAVRELRRSVVRVIAERELRRATADSPAAAEVPTDQKWTEAS